MSLVVVNSRSRLAATCGRSPVRGSAPFFAALILALGGCQLHKGKAERDGGATAPSGKPGAAPKIIFAELEHDLGTVDDRAPVSHDFKFKNAGDATLIIEKVGST